MDIINIVLGLSDVKGEMWYEKNYLSGKKSGIKNTTLFCMAIFIFRKSPYKKLVHNKTGSIFHTPFFTREVVFFIPHFAFNI